MALDNFFLAFVELENCRGAALQLLEMEPSNDNTQSDTNDDDNNTILKKGESAVFRGTDGLPFNFLQLTKDYQ